MLDLVVVGFVLMVAGIAVILVAVMASAGRRHGEREEAEVKGAGVIMIGPIPIIFGTDTKWVVVAIVLAIVLVLLGLLETRI